MIGQFVFLPIGPTRLRGGLPPKLGELSRDSGRQSFCRHLDLEIEAFVTFVRPQWKFLSGENFSAVDFRTQAMTSDAPEFPILQDRAHDRIRAAPIGKGRRMKVDGIF